MKKQKLAYGKLGYRTDKWFDKKLGQYAEIKAEIEPENRMLTLLSFVENKIKAEDFIDYDPNQYSFVKQSVVHVINMANCGVDIFATLRVHGDKRYLLHRNYRKYSDTVTSYDLMDEYNPLNNTLILFRDDAEVIEEINKQREKINARLIGKNAKAHEIRVEIMEELAQKRKIIEEKHE